MGVWLYYPVFSLLVSVVKGHPAVLKPPQTTLGWFAWKWPHELGCLSAWWNSWGEIRRRGLLEEVCHWGRAFVLICSLCISFVNLSNSFADFWIGLSVILWYNEIRVFGFGPCFLEQSPKPLDSPGWLEYLGALLGFRMWAFSKNTQRDWRTWTLK